MSPVYEIGPFRLDPEAGVLTHAGQPMALGARAVAVLTALVKHANEYVQKSNILDAAWPGVVVEESNLAVQISSIRRVLARAPGGEHWVETLARRGYRFVGPVTEANENGPTRASSEPPNSNLPEPQTSFIGRERELVEIKRLLPGTRLLTLVGIGGIGKTRLALQAAAEVIPAYRDGVWLVDLASLVDPALVPSAVAQVLDVREAAGKPLIETLCGKVKGRQLLLMLDNCEHLLGACARLADAMLRSAAELTIMATSRESLHVAGEQTYPLLALSLPDPNAGSESVARSEAVQLFVERAQKQQPDFTLTVTRAPAVAQLCVHLDGIPLAIELAAARVRSLSVEQINLRLHDRFRLLTGGTLTALPRQRTLRATLDWSYDLLGEQERAALRRLAVFTGGFTLEAAEAVCAGGDIGTSDVLDLVTVLVEKSLVELEAGGERYRLLETVREYLLEKLDVAGESHLTQTRHLDCFLTFAERVRPELHGPEQGKWLARLDLDRENLLAAHAWCDHAERGAELGLRLVSVVQLYWLPRGLIELGHRITVEALARAGAQARDFPRGDALYAASQLAYFMGAFEQTKKHAEECLSIAQEIGNRERAAAALLLLGYASEALRQSASAQAYFEESADIARALGDMGRLSFALNGLAGLHWENGDFNTAESLFEESLALARQLGDRESIAIGLPNVARVALDRGAGDRARLLLREAVVIADEIGSTRAGQYVLEVAASLGVLRAEWTCAVRFFGAVDEQMAQMGLQRPPAEDAFLALRIAKARAELGDATFATVEADGRALSYEAALGEVREWLDK